MKISVISADDNIIGITNTTVLFAEVEENAKFHLKDGKPPESYPVMLF